MSLEQVLIEHSEFLKANTLALNNMLKVFNLNYPLKDENIVNELQTFKTEIQEEQALLASDEFLHGTKYSTLVEKEEQQEPDQTVDVAINETDVAINETESPNNETFVLPTYQETAQLVTRISTEKGIAHAKAFLSKHGLKSLRELPEGYNFTQIYDEALACCTS